MDREGSLPRAADPADSPESEGGTLPSARRAPGGAAGVEEGSLPSAFQGDERAPAGDGVGEGLPEGPAPVDPAAHAETRRARIRQATAEGGLRALPAGFGDDGGDWLVVESESPFERLFLDAEQHARITPALVEAHYRLVGGFWDDVVANLDGPGQAYTCKKYGGPSRAPEVVRQRKRMTEQAYRALVREAGVAAAFAEVDRRRRDEGRRRLEPTVRGMLVDGELSSLETAAIIEFGRQYELREAETADLVHEALGRGGFVAYGDPAGETLAQRLLSVTWVTAARREALERQRQAAQSAVVRPLKLPDGEIRSLEDLIAYADANPRSAAHRLYDGTFGDWLRGTLGEVRLRDEAEAIRLSRSHARDEGTELFVRLLAAEVGAEAAPRLRAGQGQLALGTLPQGGAGAVPLVLRRDGPRRAWGTVEVEGALPGLAVPGTFAVSDPHLSVRLDTLHAPPGLYEGALVMRPEGGAAVRVPVSYTVAPIQVELKPSKLTLGRLRFKSRREVKLALRVVTDGGRLTGAARIEPPHAGLTVKGAIDGPLSVLTVGVDTSAFEAGERYEGAVKLDVNAGAFEVPLAFGVQVAWARVVAWAVAFGVLVGGLLGGVRYLMADQAAAFRHFTPDGGPGAVWAPSAAWGFFVLLSLVLAGVWFLARALYRGAKASAPKAETGQGDG